ncbi:FecR family protein [Pedobacter metabolipauper]|uniref:FecR family protein n=1 Tax=Pedobacter metabolipauper TaxID=425513 RepID=A0A4R6T0M8_9SPHI|nr:FecR family protein [Pedobacter metabolipauper]TDQ11589.1 FecR family protein [Pedobacter metabolipauper]
MVDHKEYIHGLLFEKIAGTISEQDNVVAEQAIMQHAEVREFWESLTSKMNSEQGKAFMANLDADQAWDHAQPKIVHSRDTHVKNKNGMKVAAAAILILALPLAWLFIRSNPDPQQLTKINPRFGLKQVYLKTTGGKTIDLATAQTIQVGQTQINAGKNELSYTANDAENDQWATLVVPPTKDYKIKLSDGTVVWINAATTLRFPFTFGKGTREVYLDGEAYFEVTKNKKQEFIVHTTHADVHVYGTKFNMNAYSTGKFTTSLISGSVSAKKGNRFIPLNPGEEVYILQEAVQIRPFDPSEVLSWINGTYQFHNQPLSDIAEVLTRWYDVKVSYQSSSLASQTFTGEIDKKQTLDLLLSNLQLSSGIKGELKDGVLTFR